MRYRLDIILRLIPWLTCLHWELIQQEVKVIWSPSNAIRWHWHWHQDIQCRYYITTRYSQFILHKVKDAIRWRQPPHDRNFASNNLLPKYDNHVNLNIPSLFVTCAFSSQSTWKGTFLSKCSNEISREILPSSLRPRLFHRKYYEAVPFFFSLSLSLSRPHFRWIYWQSIDVKKCFERRHMVDAWLGERQYMIGLKGLTFRNISGCSGSNYLLVAFTYVAIFQRTRILL